jgi:hypothetical protein
MEIGTTNGMIRTKEMNKTNPFILLLIGILAMVLIALIPFGAAFIILLWTGEILRYIFSLGRRRPRWGISAFPKSGWHSELISQLSMYLGIAFWLLMFVLLRNLWSLSA